MLSLALPVLNIKQLLLSLSGKAQFGMRRQHNKFWLDSLTVKEEEERRKQEVVKNLLELKLLITAEVTSNPATVVGVDVGIRRVFLRTLEAVFPMIPEPNLWADIRERDRSFDEVTNLLSAHSKTLARHQAAKLNQHEKCWEISPEKNNPMLP